MSDVSEEASPGFRADAKSTSTVDGVRMHRPKRVKDVVSTLSIIVDPCHWSKVSHVAVLTIIDRVETTHRNCKSKAPMKQMKKQCVRQREFDFLSTKIFSSSACTTKETKKRNRYKEKRESFVPNRRT